MNATANNISCWKDGNLLLASSTSPLENQKPHPATPFFMKKTTSLCSVFGTDRKSNKCNVE